MRDKDSQLEKMEGSTDGQVTMVYAFAYGSIPQPREFTKEEYRVMLERSKELKKQTSIFYTIYRNIKLCFGAQEA